MEASEIGDLKELTFTDPALSGEPETNRTSRIHRPDNPFISSEENCEGQAGDEVCRLFVENGIIFNYDYLNLKREERMQEEANPKATIDPFYWNKLSQLHPTDVCNRTEAT